MELSDENATIDTIRSSVSPGSDSDGSRVAIGWGTGGVEAEPNGAQVSRAISPRIRKVPRLCSMRPA